MVFNANLSNVSVRSLVSALLVEETTDLPHVYWWRKPPTCRKSIGGGNHRPAACLLVVETTDLPHVYWWRKPPTCRMSIGGGNHRPAACLLVEETTDLPHVYW
jgi:hypothetical protein